MYVVAVGPAVTVDTWHSVYTWPSFIMSDGDPLLVEATAGGLSSLLTCVLLYPIDSAKTRVQSGRSKDSVLGVLLKERLTTLLTGLPLKSRMAQAPGSPSPNALRSAKSQRNGRHHHLFAVKCERDDNKA